MDKKILALDIGNTNIVCGLFDAFKKDSFEHKPYRFKTDLGATVDEYGYKIDAMLAKQNIQKIKYTL